MNIMKNMLLKYLGSKNREYFLVVESIEGECHPFCWITITFVISQFYHHLP